MQMTAVYACVRILSESIAGLPIHVYTYTDSGSKEKAIKHPLYRLIHDEPNPEMTSFVFRETLMTHLLLYGNAYAQIIRNGKGEVIALYPLMAKNAIGLAIATEEYGAKLFANGATPGGILEYPGTVKNLVFLLNLFHRTVIKMPMRNQNQIGWHCIIACIPLFP